MKILKKSLAILLAVTMSLSVMAMSAYAEKAKVKAVVKILSGDTQKTEDKLINTTQQIKLGLYFTNESGEQVVGRKGAYGVGVTLPSGIIDNVVNEDENSAWSATLSSEKDYVDVGTMLTTQNNKFNGETPFVILTVKLKSIAVNTPYEFGIANTTSTLFPDCDVDATSKAKVSFFEETEIKSATEVTDKTVAYGADINTAGLPSEVSCATETTTGKTSTMNIGVTWNLTEVKTAPTVTEGEKTINKLTDANKTLRITGTLNPTAGIKNTANVKAIATVTITPIAGTVPTDVKADLKQPKVAPSTDEEKLNAVKDILPTTLDLKQGDITDKVSVTWNDATAYPTTNAIGAKFKVKGNVNADSENGLFKFAATAVEAEVTIVTPEVEGGTITVDNAAKYGNATVKFTIPAAAGLKKDDEITASIYAQDGATKGIAATALETSAPIKVTEEEAGKDYTNSIKFSSFDTLKLDTNNVFYVKVFVNGAPLLNGTGKDAKDYVESYVLPESNRRPNNGGGNSGGTVVVKKHDVKVTEGTNGTATVDKEAKVGDTVKVDVKPNEGYKVKEIIVKTADGKTIEVDQKNRTFVMPDGDVTVEVVYEEGTEEPTVADGKFTDVPDTFWAAADIYTLKEAGIINGKSDKEFDPEGKVTRAEFTKMIVNLFGVKASQNTVAFTDCKADDWFTPFVAAAVEAGYVKGITDTEFAPDKTITREEACTILGRAYAKTSDKALNFTDASEISDFATAYVALLVDMGYVNGYEDGTFLPKNEITRAEAAKIIASAFRAAEKAKTEVKADDKTDAKADAKTDAKADNGETPEK